MPVDDKQFELKRALMAAEGTTLVNNAEEQWDGFRETSAALLKEMGRQRRLFSIALIALMESVNAFQFEFSMGDVRYKAHCYAGVVFVDATPIEPDDTSAAPPPAASDGVG